MGWELISGWTLQRWHVLFCTNGGLFHNPLAYRARKPRLPPFLELNPSVRQAITSFCRSHVDSLSVELLHDHIHRVILPDLAKENKMDVSNILSSFILKKLSFGTILRWMHVLNFRYCTRKKLIMWIITRDLIQKGIGRIMVHTI